MSRIIALLTDFGMTDSYVGVMKGVIARGAREANVIDITHAIRPQDILHGAYTLAVTVPYFPRNTIFCCIVDPGVGSSRHPVAVRAGNWKFVAPDNGVLSLIMQQYPPFEAVILNNPEFHLRTVSATFHGRDIFAPVAAHLATGKAMRDMGDPLDPSALKSLEIAVPQRTDERIEGQILHIDHFGNIITTIRREHLGALDAWVVQAGGAPLCHGVYRTFADVEKGAPVAYIGSDGYLEIAIRNGNAATHFDLRVGMTIQLVA